RRQVSGRESAHPWACWAETKPGASRSWRDECKARCRSCLPRTGWRGGLMAGRLDGKTAIVTGATEGIGAAVARLFRAEGARQVLVARRPEPGRQLVSELGEDCARFLAADVAEEATAKAAVQEAVDAFGRLDILVNNAAVDFVHEIAGTTREDLERVFASNFFGAFAMLREAGSAMRGRGGGSIVNVTSRNASVGVPNMGAYAAAKGALLSLTRVAALEWAADG